MAELLEYRDVLSELDDHEGRLNSLYTIIDKEGQETIFEMNDAQRGHFLDMWPLNIILKARQLGFSTFILMYMLDQCLFTANTNCGIIDLTIDDAKAKLAKIQFAYDKLDPLIKRMCPLKVRNKTEMTWHNGSSIKVGTSHRGGTLQFLHISEFGKIASKFPEKAKEIRTGTLNTIKHGQVAWIESTAEGVEGDFYAMCDLAQGKLRNRAHLTEMDFKFSFWPWHYDPGYRIDPEGVMIPEGFERYFKRLETEPGYLGSKPIAGIKLSPAQKAWYVKKAETQMEDMKREYPATPKEAFEASIQGAIFGPQMEAAEFEGRVGSYPAIPGIPVHTFWDIGRRDYTSIFFAQILFGPRVRVVGFYQNCFSELPHYVEHLLGSKIAAAKFPHMTLTFTKNSKGVYVDNGWIEGDAYFPHDIKVTEWGTGKTRVEEAIRAGLKARLGVDQSLHDGINAARATLAITEFDELPTAEGRQMLKGYRWVWDDKMGCWDTKEPAHNMASHGSDAYRTLATSWREIVPIIPKDPPPGPGPIAKAVVPVKPLTGNDLMKLSKIGSWPR